MKTDFYKQMENNGLKTKIVNTEDISSKQKMLNYIDNELKILNERNSIELTRESKYDRRMWSSVRDNQCELRIKVDNKKVYFGRDNIGKSLYVNGDLDSVRNGINNIRTFIDNTSYVEFQKPNGDYELFYTEKKTKKSYSLHNRVINDSLKEIEKVIDKTEVSEDNKLEEFDNVFN